MRDILKPQSGTQSGTPVSAKKILKFCKKTVRATKSKCFLFLEIW